MKMNKNEIFKIKEILYSQQDIIDEILNFFKTEIGVKCRVGMNVGKTPHYYDYIADYENSKLVHINKDNIMENLMRYDTLYFLECIFDEEITRKEINDNLFNHIIGITATMDIDAPSIIENGKKVSRKDFFNNDVYKNFVRCIRIIDSELKEVEQDYKMIFSGNGIYVICDEFYGKDADELQLYMNNFIELVKDVNWMLKKENIDIDIDERAISWNRFFKVPWSIHINRRRISIPITIEDLMDKNLLMDIVSVDNLLGR